MILMIPRFWNLGVKDTSKAMLQRTCLCAVRRTPPTMLPVRKALTSQLMQDAVVRDQRMADRMADRDAAAGLWPKEMQRWGRNSSAW